MMRFLSVCLAPFWRIFIFILKNQNGSNGSSLWTPTSASSSVHHQPFILAPPPAGTASHGNHHHLHNSSSSSNNTNGSTSTGSPMKVPVKPPPLKSLPVIFSFLTIFVFIYLFISTFLECITAFVWIRWRPNRSALSFRPGSQHGRPASSSAPDVAVQPGYSLALSDPIFSFNFVVTRLRWSGQWLVVFGWTSPPPTTTFFTSSWRQTSPARCPR